MNTLSLSPYLLEINLIQKHPLLSMSIMMISKAEENLIEYKPGDLYVKQRELQYSGAELDSMLIHMVSDQTLLCLFTALSIKI